MAKKKIPKKYDWKMEMLKEIHGDKYFQEKSRKKIKKMKRKFNEEEE